MNLNNFNYPYLWKNLEEGKLTPIPTRVTARPTNTRGKPFFPSRTRTTTSSTTSAAEEGLTRQQSSASELPATVRETAVKKQTINLQKPSPSPSVLADDDHPQDNEISGSGVDNARAKIAAGVSEPTGPYRIDRSDTPTHQAKLNLGAVIALGVFGAFVFLAAVITTVVILIRR